MRLIRYPSSALALLLIGACSGSGGDTHLRFDLEGESFDLTHVIFGLSELNEPGWHFVEIGHDITKVGVADRPAASVQWRMKFDDVTDLAGRRIDLDRVTRSDMAAPLVLFDLSDERSVYNDPDSKLYVTVARVDGDYVEGTFKCKNLVYFTGTATKRLDVTGSYRARLMQ